MVLASNISPLIPNQFPDIYKADGPNFINFVQAYYQWMEQPFAFSNTQVTSTDITKQPVQFNPTFASRNSTQIRDIDDTFEQFIVYFKNKYLKNIKFSTSADIRMIIKHALDIYRSKGTERCATLLFQAAFGATPGFYYPSTDLFRPSDGTWRILNYLELSFDWTDVIKLQQKEIQGTFSGATAFVDNIILRKTNGRFENVAYVSAIVGQFQVGERVFPTDGSLPLSQCPFINGSLNTIQFGFNPSGQNYQVGSSITVNTTYGQAGVIRIANTVNQSGVVGMQFVDGGWGYSLTKTQATIGYTGLTNSTAFANGVNVYEYYANGSIAAIGNLLVANAPVSNAGILHIKVLQGNFNTTNTLYTFANGANATVANLATNLITPNVYISNVNLNLTNVVMTTSNLEFGQYFYWQDLITEPLNTVNFILANGTFQPGMNVYTWSNSTTIAGNGVVLNVNQTNATAGIMTISVLGGSMNVANAILTSGNTIGCNLTASNGVTNTTATGTFIANSGLVTLLLSNVNGTFIAGEQIFQSDPNYGPFPDLKIGGWGVITTVINSTSITVSNTVGKFTAAEGVLDSVSGKVSGATANVVSASIQVGLVNTSNNLFIASPYAFAQSSYTTCIVANATYSGTGFNLLIANSLLYTANVNVDTDPMANLASVLMSATAYGFPANPVANGSSGSMDSCLNNMALNVGKFANVFIGGFGQNYFTIPYVVIDQPEVSGYYVYNDIITVTGATGSFTPGQVVSQASSNAQGVIVNIGNSSIFEIQRMTFANGGYANDFVITTNPSNILTGPFGSANIVSIDYDYLNTSVMGRNSLITTVFTSGNNAVVNGSVLSSGFGFANGEQVLIGSNGAVGTAIIGGLGTSQGFYATKGGFLSDQKKLYDGYFWQNFSYEIISPLMIEKYNQMIQELTHVSGTLLFGNYVRNSYDNNHPFFTTSNISNTTPIPPLPLWYIDFNNDVATSNGVTSNSTQVLSVSRASGGYAQYSNGSWAYFLNNIARRTNQGLLVEESRTQLIPYTSTFASDWAAQPGNIGQVTTNITSPFPNSSVWQATYGGVGDTNSGAVGSGNIPSLAYGNTYTQSVWLYIVGGTGVTQAQFTAEGATAFGGSVSANISITNQWQFISFTSTVSSNVALSVNTAVVFRVSGTSGATVYYTAPQLELGPFPTSFIANPTASTVTRAGDFITVVNPPTFGSVSSLFCTATPASNNTTIDNLLLWISDGTFNNRFGLFRTSYAPQYEQSATYAIINNVTQSSDNTGIQWTGNTIGKLAGAISNTTLTTCFDNTTLLAVGATWPPTVNLTTISIGSLGGVGYWNGYVNAVGIWPNSYISNSFMQSITTI